MSEPTFKELFDLRAQPGPEIAERYGEVTRLRFDYENGLPLVVCTPDDHDVPLLLAALGRSSIPIAPFVVDNAPGRSGADMVARAMGARVVEEPVPGHMKALQAGIQAVNEAYPGSPLLVTDDDCLPQKRWAETLARHARISTSIGGIAYGGVLLEHGDSVTTDVLRTGYAALADIQRKLTHAIPKARGPNGFLQPDADNKILAEIQTHSPKAFPSDLLIEESVIAAGGTAVSVLRPRAVMFTRGDRFGSLASLAKDFIQRGKRRHELYDTD